MLLCSTVRFVRIANRIMAASTAFVKKISVRLATASISMRSALSAMPMVSIFTSAASALARV